MKHVKLIIAGFPEYYLIVLALLSGYSPPFSINPLAIGIAGGLVLQVIFKNRVAGFIIAGLLMLINLYMLLALISEFNEFTTFNTAARQLLFVGLSLFCLNSIVSFLMISRYTQNAGGFKSGIKTVI
jgi:hypothetical protein